MINFELEYDGTFSNHYLCTVKDGSHSMTYNKETQLLTCGCGIKGCIHKTLFKDKHKHLF